MSRHRARPIARLGPRDRPPRPGSVPKGRIRLLLATTGWPCGILEIGSWASRAGLAETVIFQIQPARAFRLPPHVKRLLAEGPLRGRLHEAFADHGLGLSAAARLVRRAGAPGSAADDRCGGVASGGVGRPAPNEAAPSGDDVWEVYDPGAWGRRFLLESGEDGVDVLLARNLPTAAFLQSLRRHAAAGEDLAKHFDAGGSLSPATREALLDIGVQFAGKLLDFSPHVVGFRVEGGRLDEIDRWIGAVRHLVDAEIVLGGPTATSHAGQLLVRTGADYVFAGEAEEPFNQFLRLARRPCGRDHLPEIPGLAYRYGGRTLHNTLPGDGYQRTAAERDGAGGMLPRDCLGNRVRPLAPAEVVAANRLDWTLLEGFDRATDSLFFTGGRGCPGQCSFCAKLHGRRLRLKPARQLLDEIAAADRLVRSGRLRVTTWPLFAHVADPAWQSRRVAWAAIYDEDFFLSRARAIEFFQLWDRYPLKDRYRISLQANPVSLLTGDGTVDEELLHWIGRLKPMVQLGCESFHPQVLARWRKRHSLAQMLRVLDALDTTRQDYTVFQLLTDFETTAEELVDSLRLLILAALPRPRMRIAASPYTIPLYDSDTRRLLEYGGRPAAEGPLDFTDYECPQPGWMDPLVAELADLADARLHWALEPKTRDAALVAAMEDVAGRIRREFEAAGRDLSVGVTRRARLGELLHRVEAAVNEIRDARFGFHR